MSAQTPFPFEEDEQAESEEDLDASVLVSQDRELATLSSTDWTTQTIIAQLDQGNIELNPAFQRRDAWRPKRKSQYIESLILGFPVPQVVLAERKARGSFLVIDGKQRLLTLRQFTSTAPGKGFSPFALTGLTIRKDLNGKTYDDLQKDPAHAADIRVLQNHTVRTVVIRSWQSEDFLFAVFHRLNTGSVPLSPQELRQALHPGPFLTYVNEFAEGSKAVSRMLGIAGPDFRMRDVEVVLRFVAMRTFLAEYSGNLKGILDLVSQHFNKNWAAEETRIRDELAAMDSAIEATFRIFGADSFRKWNGKSYETRFNRAVFDVMAYYFSDPKVAAAAEVHGDDIRQAWQETCADDRDFRGALEGTTKSIGSLYTRLSVWGEALQSVIHLPLKIPTRHVDRILP
jgi:hypothetical protein